MFSRAILVIFYIIVEMRYLLQTLNSLLDQILNWELRLLHCYVIFTFTVT